MERAPVLPETVLVLHCNLTSFLAPLRALLTFLSCLFSPLLAFIVPVTLSQSRTGEIIATLPARGYMTDSSPLLELLR